MKKGLRPSPYLQVSVPLYSQNRRPDEEGIKTFYGILCHASDGVRTVDLMKKGLRRLDGHPCPGMVCQNRRPDEEGIKTRQNEAVLPHVGQNRRPDEEGIKTPLCAPACKKYSQNRRPDEEGIKTAGKRMIGGAFSQNRRPDEEGIKTFLPGTLSTPASVRTVDLMKKGLRLGNIGQVFACQRQNRRPDEEGIKTSARSYVEN